jgi:hypothetical protein
MAGEGEDERKIRELGGGKCDVVYSMYWGALGENFERLSSSTMSEAGPCRSTRELQNYSHLSLVERYRQLEVLQGYITLLVYILSSAWDSIRIALRQGKETERFSTVSMWSFDARNAVTSSPISGQRYSKDA